MITVWAAALPRDTQDAIRTGRLRATVIGYASTTGTDRSNFERYSRQRAEWVQTILARALAVRPEALNVGWRGSYTAPPEDQNRLGGVPDRHERRVDIEFAETAPSTTVSVTAGGSAVASATSGAK
jgi:outer membrane protein OmpA-like peptidoglycan-associated protein